MSQDYDRLLTAFPYDKWCKLRFQHEIQNSDDITKVLEALSEVEIASEMYVRATFAAALTTEEEAYYDNVLVAQHTGEPIHMDPDPVILEPTGDSNKDLIVRGVVFEADLNTETDKDVTLTEDRDFQGVNLEVTNHADGDWMRITIEHPNPGVGTLRVLAEGSAADSGVSIPPSGSVGVVAEGTATVPAGLIIRFRYHSEASSGDKPKIYLMLRQWRESS